MVLICHNYCFRLSRKYSTNVCKSLLPGGSSQVDNSQVNIFRLFQKLFPLDYNLQVSPPFSTTSDDGSGQWKAIRVTITLQKT